MPFKDPEKAREARLKHYYANKKQYQDRNKKQRLEMQSWIQEVKDVPCQDCGVKYPYYVMDFDHRNPSEKSGEVNLMIRTGSWAKLRAEVDKCDIVCSNCHRERTYGQNRGVA